MPRTRTKSVSPSTPKKTGDPLDTPMMRQYLELKKQTPDAVLFFRMGDFYEMFLEDAEEAAPLMDVALTKRQNKIPMAGVPYHSVDTYIARLIGAGKKVAIAEQQQDPENAKLMRRVLRRVVTPGTLVEDTLLKSASHNFLMSVAEGDGVLGIALADVSTGDFFSQELEGDWEEELSSSLRDLCFKYGPSEVLVPSSRIKFYREILPELSAGITPIEDWKASAVEGGRRIDAKYGANLRGLGYDDPASPALAAASLILHYVSVSFPDGDLELSPPRFRRVQDRYMLLDEQTIRNLDLVHNLQEGGQSRTLFNILNFCRTPAGKRRLRDAVLTPLLQREDIEARLDLTAGLVENTRLRTTLAEKLDGVHDLERMLSRVSSGRGAPRDFQALRETVSAAEGLREIFGAAPEQDSVTKAFAELIQITPGTMKLAADIRKQISEEPPSILGNGPLLQDGVDPELDGAREASREGSRWIVEFEKKEKERTGISTLRVKYNRVVGYVIEISKAQAKDAPDDYQRKQTLVNGERYTCDRLVELERKIQEADSTISGIETRVFEEFCERIRANRADIKSMMQGLAELDFLLSLSLAAARDGWTRPVPVETGELVIEEGRHPVVERFLPAGESFISNSLRMDSQERSFSILTGPNMAGKSTFIRQIALIQLLMQIGSFVPARHATLSVVDRIFTRIGASDNLTRGESTFFVEMLVAARILNQSTEKSLIIMDEVGRGTSTYDGLSIAWAVVEYFTGDAGAKPRALFATHYHELTALESRLGVFNLMVDVQETDGRVIFMHRVREGPANRSYGIHVARLAGLPPEVTERAEEKLRELEEDYMRRRDQVQAEPVKPARKRKSTAKSSTKTTNEDAQGSLF